MQQSGSQKVEAFSRDTAVAIAQPKSTRDCSIPRGIRRLVGVSRVRRQQQSLRT